jgi:chaperonin GroES
MGLRPLHDWVLIRRSEAEEKTSAGIIIPDAARTRPIEGVVISVGPGRYRQEKGKKDKKQKKFVPTVLKPGQHVMFTDYMAKDVTLDGEEITLIREEDVLGIIEAPGTLAVKKRYDIEIKKDSPPMVQDKPKKAKVEATTKGIKPAEKKKEAETRAKTKKISKQLKKSALKKPQKKTVAKASERKATKKVAAKKTDVKKTVSKKPAKKTMAIKSVAKKTAAKKVAPKKAQPKKTSDKKKSVRKTAGITEK